MDAKEQAFQCYQYGGSQFTKTFFEGEDLGCVSPRDLEISLKACKEHKPMPAVTLCSIDVVRNKFFCQLQTATEGYWLDPEGADNYFCLNEKDRRRVLERCQPVAASLL